MQTHNTENGWRSVSGVDQVDAGALRQFGHSEDTGTGHGATWPAFIGPVVILLIVGFAVWQWMTPGARADGSATSESPRTIRIVGSQVERLSGGEPVEFQGRIVGAVVSVHNTWASIRLDAPKDVLPNQIRAATVETLNQWLPGNIGVRIHAAAVGEKAGDDAIRDTVAVRESRNPFPDIPPKFWIIVSGGLTLLTVLIVFWKRILAFILVVKLVHAIVAAIVGIVWLSTVVLRWMG